MARIVAGVVAGYVALALSVVLLLTLTAVAMGPQRVYADESWQPTTAWCVASLGVGLAAAIAGGLVAARIARSRKGAYGLCSLVCALGVSAAIFTTATPPADAPPRPAEMGAADYLRSAAYSRVPKWVDWANAAVGAAGTLMAARLSMRRPRTAPGGQHA